MDDDVPLSALAKAPSKTKIDDDAPLMALTSLSKKAKPGTAPANAKGKPPAAKAGAKAAPGVGVAKAKAKRTRPDSSSSSSSSYSSSSDEPQKAKAKRKAAPKKAAESKGDAKGDEDGDRVKKKDRSAKEEVVAELLCRWWYALPDWPPIEDSFYAEEFKKLKLRKVSIEEWEWVPEEDAEGRKKVYGLAQFRGLFRDSAGNLVDLRPRDTCPCYHNFMKKEMVWLHDMLVTAYENQLKELREQPNYDKKLEAALGSSLTRARNKAYNVKQMSSKR